MQDPLYRLTVRQMGHRLREQTLSARDLLAHFRARIDAINPLINAVVEIDDVGAKAASEASDTRFAAGAPLSVLDGIPVLLKDNLYAKNLKATWGTGAFADFIPATDEHAVKRLRDAGAVILGKTNVPEFTLFGHSTNEIYGATANPWDLSRVPGGSSGGAAAAIAAGLAPLALGTDAGGSIRRPAGYTGIVGLKTSAGLVPAGGGFAFPYADCAVLGPMGRTADDVRLMLSVLATPDRAEQRSLLFAPQRAVASTPAPQRILYVERLGKAPVDGDILRRSEEGVLQLEALGHFVTRGELPFSVEYINDHWSVLADVALARLARDESSFGAASAFFRAKAEKGAALLATDYVDFTEAVVSLRREAGRAFSQYDIVATPSAATMPWRLDAPIPTMIDGQDAGAKGHAVYSFWVNGSGHPAVTYPIEPIDGMPIGLQLVGDYGADALLLDIVQQAESGQPSANHWPALASAVQ